MRTLAKINTIAFYFNDDFSSGHSVTPHPDGTFPADATFLGFAPETLTVSYTTPNDDPEGDPVEGSVAFTDADVEAAKVWTPPLDLQAVLTELRAKRNELLAESDFSQLSDAPVDSAAWAVYRQELRDLPSTVDSETGQFTWPTKPNA